MYKHKKTKNGFTIVELLVTILLLSLIFSIGVYSINNIINNSKEKSAVINVNNIKTSANSYAKEYNEDIYWREIQNDSISTSCIPIQTLVSRGYLDKKILEQENAPKAIIVTKDNKTNNVLSEKESNEETCDDYNKKIQILTSKEVCYQKIYNGSGQDLIKDETIINKGYYEFNYKDSIYNNSNLPKNAGNYDVKITPKSGKVWQDNSTEPKFVTCTIEKAPIELMLTSSGNPDDPQNIGTLITKLKSNVSGKITIKTSNKEHAYGEISDNNIVANTDKEITIHTLASRNTPTYITITVTPNDNNYKKTNIVYTVGKVATKKLDKPKCNNLTYNGNSQTLVTPNDGYNLYNNTGIDYKKYTVTAKLNYGYAWKDNTTGDVIMECEIKRPTPKVTYDKHYNSCNPDYINTVYNEKYGYNNNLCIPTRTGYTFKGWYSDSELTNSITNETIVKNFNDHKLYAKWQVNKIFVKFNTNEGIITGGNQTRYTADSNGLVSDNNLKDDKTNIRTYKYQTDTKNTDISIDLINYNNQEHLYITRTGYLAKSKAQWIKTDGSKTFTQASTTINSKDLCDASNGDCTVTLKVNWQPIKYTIAYKLNNGTKGTNTPTSATYDSAVQISNPTKTVTIVPEVNGTGATIGSSTSKAQTFNGWTSTTSSGLVTSQSKFGTTNNPTTSWDGTVTKNSYFKNLRTTSGTVTLTANWTPEALNLPTISKIGYTCNWNDKKDGSGKTYESGVSYTPTSNSASTITLYAICTAKTYKITYKGNSGTTTDGKTTLSQNVEYDSTYITKKNSFKYTGHTFTGWTENQDGTGANWTSNIDKEQKWTYDKNITLYAQWKTNTYTIKYDPNGGTGTMDPTTVTYGTGKDTTPNAFTRTGYKFVGWELKIEDNSKWRYVNSDEKLAWYKEGSQPSGYEKKVYKDGFNSKTLISTNNAVVIAYAKWEPITYTIKYNANGGTGTTTSSTHKYDTAQNLTANGFTRTGYTFTGWAKSKTGTKVHDNKESVKNLTTIDNETIELYAIWRINKVNVKYSVNGGTIKTTTVKSDQTATYTWSTDSSGIITRKTNGANAISILDTVNYGSKLASNGLVNWNNSNYVYITRSGYSVASNEWKCLSNNCIQDTYDHGTAYEASKLCDASKEDCTITLGVNWVENDTTKPTCSITKTSSSWSPNGVTIKVTCSDSGSGCKTASYTATTQSKTPTGTVTDNAGNTGTCKGSISINTRKMYHCRTRTCSRKSNTETVPYYDHDGYNNATCKKEGGEWVKHNGEFCCKIGTTTKRTYYVSCGSWGSWSDYIHTSDLDEYTNYKNVPNQELKKDCRYRTEYK